MSRVRLRLSLPTSRGRRSIYRKRYDKTMQGIYFPWSMSCIHLPLILIDDRCFFTLVRMLRTSREIFIYLSHLGTRLRSSSEWGSVSFQTIDCTASSLVFAYALYLSCISLRRNASRSPPDVFQTTHKVILSALAQSEALCERVYPVEVTIPLRCCIAQEFELARHGLCFS